MNHALSASVSRRMVLAILLSTSLSPATFGQDQAKPKPKGPAAGFEDITKEGYEAFVRTMVGFAKDQIAKLPSSDKTARENAYGKLAAIQLAGAAGTLVLPAAGLTLGGGIGLCVDACTAGVDAGTGTAVGSAIGVGSGMVVGFSGFVAALLATVSMVDEIEAKYPPEAGSAASGGGAMAMVFRNAPRGAHAGTAESFYVNLVACLPDHFVTLVESWDRTPGLRAQDQRWLASVAFARPALTRIATIKKTLRVTPHAGRAQDLFLDVGRVLSGDAAAQERMWLAALGLGSTGLALKGGKLSLDVPPPLVDAGLPKTLSAKVPDLRFKVGGDGGLLDPYLRVALDAGPFDLDLGKVTVVESGSDQDRIRVDWSLAKGSRLGSLELLSKSGGDEGLVCKLAPKLGEALAISAFFKLDGLSLELDKVRVGGLDVRLGLPKELRDLPVVKDLVNAVEDAFEKHVKKFVQEHLPFAGIFAGLEKGSVRSLEKRLAAEPQRYGLASIRAVEKAEIKNGKIRLRVKGKELSHPKLATTPQQAASEWAAFAKQR